MNVKLGCYQLQTLMMEGGLDWLLMLIVLMEVLGVLPIPLALLPNSRDLKQGLDGLEMP